MYIPGKVGGARAPGAPTVPTPMIGFKGFNDRYIGFKGFNGRYIGFKILMVDTLVLKVHVHIGLTVLMHGRYIGINSRYMGFKGFNSNHMSFNGNHIII